MNNMNQTRIFNGALNRILAAFALMTTTSLLAACGEEHPDESGDGHSHGDSDHGHSH